jgi:AhpD family alkylhydroperoxidase
MDEKTSVFICLGASVAANCVDCFRHYHQEARRIGLDPPEIDAAVALAAKVKTGANIAVMSAVADATGRPGRQSAVREDAMPSCCSH